MLTFTMSPWWFFFLALPLHCFFTSLLGMGWTAIRYLGSASKHRNKPEVIDPLSALFYPWLKKSKYNSHVHIAVCSSSLGGNIRINSLSYQTQSHTVVRSQEAEWTVWRTCCCRSPGCNPQAWCQRWDAKTSSRWCLLSHWYGLSCSGVSLWKQERTQSVH